MMKGLPHSLLLLLLLAGAINSGKASTCVANAPMVEQREENTPWVLEANSEDSLVAVMPDYVFSCEGVVTQWRLHWRQQIREGCEIIFDFHVLRQRNSGGNCTLTSVGKNRMIVAVDSSQLSDQDSVFNTSEVNRIKVKPGDTMGLTVKFNQSQKCTRDNSNSSGTVMIIESANVSTSVYYRRVHYDRATDSETTFNVCNDKDVDNRLNETDDSVKTDDTPFQVYAGAPRITAVIDPEIKTDLDLELLVGAGAGGGALVLVAAGLMAIVLMRQCSKRKRKACTASSTEPSQPQVILKDYKTQGSIDNEANDEEATQKVSLKPPPQCTQYKMQGNVAYSVHTTSHGYLHPTTDTVEDSMLGNVTYGVTTTSHSRPHLHPHLDSTTDTVEDSNEGYDTLRAFVSTTYGEVTNSADGPAYDMPYSV